MTSQQLVREAQTRLKRLSPDDLRVALAFLTFLETTNTQLLSKSDRAAVLSFKRAWTQAQSGKIKPMSELRWSSK